MNKYTKIKFNDGTFAFRDNDTGVVYYNNGRKQDKDGKMSNYDDPSIKKLFESKTDLNKSSSFQLEALRRASVPFGPGAQAYYMSAPPKVDVVEYDNSDYGKKNNAGQAIGAIASIPIAATVFAAPEFIPKVLSNPYVQAGMNSLWVTDLTKRAADGTLGSGITGLAQGKVDANNLVTDAFDLIGVPSLTRGAAKLADKLRLAGGKYLQQHSIGKVNIMSNTGKTQQISYEIGSPRVMSTDESSTAFEAAHRLLTNVGKEPIALYSYKDFPVLASKEIQLSPPEYAKVSSQLNLINSNRIANGLPVNDTELVRTGNYEYLVRNKEDGTFLILSFKDLNNDFTNIRTWFTTGSGMQTNNTVASSFKARRTSDNLQGYRGSSQSVIQGDGRLRETISDESQQLTQRVRGATNQRGGVPSVDTRNGGIARAIYKAVNDTKGNVRGFNVNGNIHYFTLGADAETLMHEWSEVWADDLMVRDPNAWSSLKKNLQTDNAELWSRVLGDSDYANLVGDEDKIAKEVFGRFSGSNGARKLEEAAKKDPSLSGIINNIKKALELFWKNIADTFGFRKFSSSQEAADQALYDLITGKRLDYTSSNSIPSFRISAEPTNNSVLRSKDPRSPLRSTPLFDLFRFQIPFFKTGDLGYGHYYRIIGNTKGLLSAVKHDAILPKNQKYGYTYWAKDEPLREYTSNGALLLRYNANGPYKFGTGNFDNPVSAIDNPIRFSDPNVELYGRYPFSSKYIRLDKNDLSKAYKMAKLNQYIEKPAKTVMKTGLYYWLYNKLTNDSDKSQQKKRK